MAETTAETAMGIDALDSLNIDPSASWSSFVQGRRILPIEPTHIILQGDIETIRSKVAEVLRLIDANLVDGIYEQWLDNTLIHFTVSFIDRAEAGGEAAGRTAAVAPAPAPASWVVEFRKLRGCTFSFVNMYVSILKVFKMWASSVPPQVVVEPLCASACWDWIDSHSQTYGLNRPRSIRLEYHLDSVSEMIDPLIHTISSIWSESQQSGLEGAACLTELHSNATILARDVRFLKALGSIDAARCANRGSLRCLAKTVANLFLAPWHDEEPPARERAGAEELGETISWVDYLTSLATRLIQVSRSHQGEPAWYHINKQVARLTRRLEG
jgi:hypothetical protein